MSRVSIIANNSTGGPVCRHHIEVLDESGKPISGIQGINVDINMLGVTANLRMVDFDLKLDGINSRLISEIEVMSPGELIAIQNRLQRKLQRVRQRIEEEFYPTWLRCCYRFCRWMSRPVWGGGF